MAISHRSLSLPALSSSATRADLDPSTPFHVLASHPRAGTSTPHLQVMETPPCWAAPQPTTLLYMNWPEEINKNNNHHIFGPQETQDQLPYSVDANWGSRPYGKQNWLPIKHCLCILYFGISLETCPGTVWPQPNRWQGTHTHQWYRQVSVLGNFPQCCLIH